MTTAEKQVGLFTGESEEERQKRLHLEIAAKLEAMKAQARPLQESPVIERDVKKRQAGERDEEE